VVTQLALNIRIRFCRLSPAYQGKIRISERNKKTKTWYQAHRVYI